MKRHGNVDVVAAVVLNGNVIAVVAVVNVNGNVVGDAVVKCNGCYCFFELSYN